MGLFGKERVSRQIELSQRELFDSPGTTFAKLLETCGEEVKFDWLQRPIRNLFHGVGVKRVVFDLPDGRILEISTDSLQQDPFSDERVVVRVGTENDIKDHETVGQPFLYLTKAGDDWLQELLVEPGWGQAAVSAGDNQDRMIDDFLASLG